MKKWLGCLLMAPLILFTVFISGRGILFLFEHEATEGLFVILALVCFCAGFSLYFGGRE